MTIPDSEIIGSPDIEAYEAMKLLDSSDAQAAIRRCHEAIGQYGPNRNCYLVKARAHIEQEEYGFAEEALQSVLRLDPEHPAAWAMIGEVYFRLGKESKVEYCRNRLESIFPALADYFDQVESEDENDTIEISEEEFNAETESIVPDLEKKHEAETESIAPDVKKDIEDKAESIVPFEDFDQESEKQNEDYGGLKYSENKEETNQVELTEQIKPGQDKTGGLKTEIFETATFADICFKQGKYEKALKVYKKLLMGAPDNSKFIDKIKTIESKMGLK